MRLLSILFAASILTALSVSPTHAAQPGQGSCSISPNPAAVGTTYVVSATGLPTSSPINLFVTAPDGTMTGSPLGSTPDGTFNLQESSPSTGTYTYQFTGLVKNNFDATKVYAACSVTVQ